jgi:hypothetical protein
MTIEKPSKYPDDPSQVIVRTAYDLHIPTVEVSHRDFPEIRRRGPSAALAGRRLATDLAMILDTAQSRWERETIEAALSDVLSFVG